jgi:SsrA-binding protein
MAAKRKTEPTEPGVKNIAVNRRASFDYELGERFEAGLVLIGSEVKSLRCGSANVAEAWARVTEGEAFLEGMRIPSLRHAAFGHKEDRARKLLLHQREIQQLLVEIERKGMTIIITRIYFRDGLVKVELAVAKGRRQHDKREAIKQRDADRETRTIADRIKRMR